MPSKRIRIGIAYVFSGYITFVSNVFVFTFSSINLLFFFNVNVYLRVFVLVTCVLCLCSSSIIRIILRYLLHFPHYVVSPFPFHLVLLRHKYSPRHPILKHPQPASLPQCKRKSSTHIQNRQNYNYVSLNLCIFG